MPFADPSAPEELRAAFDALAAALPAGPPGANLGAKTEVFWATLHGLVTLTRDERIRVGSASSRITVLVDGLLSAAAG
ncbi:MAG: hypothetical protein M3Y35_06050 [Actinomycetota bacterium]|nr:hypothetical protein [Actinomycetota bacterium]